MLGLYASTETREFHPREDAVVSNAEFQLAGVPWTLQAHTLGVKLMRGYGSW